MLIIQNLSVSYGSRKILHDISLNVQSGEVLALIGPNGAGKSTLIRAVSGVIPYTGQIRTNGDDFAALGANQRARYVATVPQAISLPPAFTVWETVHFGRTPYLGFLGQPSSRDEEIVRQSLERVSALPLADRRVASSQAENSSVCCWPGRYASPHRSSCSTNPPRIWTCNIK